MDIYDIIRSEHDDVKDLLMDLGHNDNSPEEALELYEQIKDQLKGHTHREERMFYPHLRKGDIEIQVDDAKNDHRMIDHALKKLGSIEPLSAEWFNSVRQLTTAIESHVNFEETVLFEKAQVLIDADTAARLKEAWQKDVEKLAGGRQSA